MLLKLRNAGGGGVAPCPGVEIEGVYDLEEMAVLVVSKSRGEASKRDLRSCDITRFGYVPDYVS